MKFCSITGCKELITDAQAETTEKLFGKAVCVNHEKEASKDALKQSDGFTLDTAPYIKCGFAVENGVAAKIIGQAEITIDIAGVAAGKTKIQTVQIGGYNYEYGLNPEVDREIKALFELIKPKKEAPPAAKAKPESKPRQIAAPPSESSGLGTSLATIQEITLSPENIIKMLCPDATFEEAVLFLQVCKHRGLNPFIPGEIFLIKYDKTQPAATVVGKYAFTKKADAHPDYKGYSSGIIVLDVEGKLVEREGTFYLPRGRNWKEGDVSETLVGGWARVKRKDREDYVVKVALQECIKTNREGQPVRGWRDQPATMVQKVAVVRAHRDAFPAELGGLYDRDELGVSE